VGLSSSGSAAESVRAFNHWRAWWRQNGADFVPKKPTACRDW
jgi:hypothetical protein